jgi:hypothetical protein
MITVISMIMTMITVISMIMTTGFFMPRMAIITRQVHMITLRGKHTRQVFIVTTRRIIIMAARDTPICPQGRTGLR